MATDLLKVQCVVKEIKLSKIICEVKFKSEKDNYAVEN